MDLNRILQIVKRWLAAVIVMPLVVMGVLGYRAATADPIYEGSVTIQVTAPQSDTVSIFDTNRQSSNVRDDITVALNNFTEVLQSDEVRARTVRQLSLNEKDALFKIDTKPLRDSDFTAVTVDAATPQLAAGIANVQVTNAIVYYGEVRSKPAQTARQFLSTQVATAEKNLRDAESALSDFQIQNGISNFDTDVATLQKTIENLELERNNRLLFGPSNPQIDQLRQIILQLQVERETAFAQGDPDRTAKLDQSIARYNQQLTQLQGVNPTDQVDKVLDQRHKELQRLLALQPKFNSLQQGLQQVRTTYNDLQSKYSEAALKEQVAQAASYIQVIQPALAPLQPVPARLAIVLVLGLLGGLVLGIILAFGLDYLFKPGRQRQVQHEPKRVPVDGAGKILSGTARRR
jgi:polysaccharide biosynthesis transport protein